MKKSVLILRNLYTKNDKLKLGRLQNTLVLSGLAEVIIYNLKEKSQNNWWSSS